MTRSLLAVAGILTLAGWLAISRDWSPLTSRWHCIEHSTETSLVEHGDESVYTVHVFCTKYERAQ